MSRPSGVRGCHALSSQSRRGRNASRTRISRFPFQRAPLRSGSVAVRGTVPACLQIVRSFTTREAQKNPQSRRLREALQTVSARGETTTDAVAVPLDPAIWRDHILQTSATGAGMVPEIRRSRAALVYCGLAALATRRSRGGIRARYAAARANHAAIFAAFGRSVHVRAGSVVVPGRLEAEPLWKVLTGRTGQAAPSCAFDRCDGRLAFLYDTIAHLDGRVSASPLDDALQTTSPNARLRSLLDSFVVAAHRLAHRRTAVLETADRRRDSLVHRRGHADGAGAAPFGIRLWDRVFRADELTESQSRRSRRDSQVSERLNAMRHGWPREFSSPYALDGDGSTRCCSRNGSSAPAASAAAAVATALRGYNAVPR